MHETFAAQEDSNRSKESDQVAEARDVASEVCTDLIEGEYSQCKTVLVSDLSPLWCCKNAIQVQYCTFAWCNNCYIKESKTGERQREKRSRATSEDSADCNHNLDCLQIFTDKRYFKQDYQDQLKDQGENIPTHCFRCAKKIVAVFSLQISSHHRPV